MVSQKFEHLLDAGYDVKFHFIVIDSNFQTYAFPVSESKSSLVPAKQEVVRLDLAEHEEPVCSMVEQNVSHPAITATANVAIEIKYGNMTLRLFNGADALVIQNTLKCIGGVSHAW